MICMSTHNDILHVQGVKSNGFGIIPKLVMQDTRLTRDAKAIYAYFCSYAGGGDTAFPTVSKICHDLGFGSEDTYRKHFKLLVKYGYIKVEQVRDSSGRFSHNVYTLVDKPEPEETEDTKVVTDTQNLGDGEKPHENGISTDTQKHGDGKIRGRKNWVTNNNSNINNNSDINNNFNNNIKEYNCLKEVKARKENVPNTDKNVVVVKKDRKKKNTSADYKIDEKIKYFKQKIEEVTGEVVVEEFLKEFLKEPGADVKLEHALKVYGEISRVILTANDIQNPVGLLFYIARNNVQPPKGRRADTVRTRSSFNNFEQHEYSAEELESLFESF